MGKVRPVTSFGHCACWGDICRVARYYYRKRNVIERFFACIKKFRRVATRYDKLASRFVSFAQLAGPVLWLK